jgi:hypothetical protein
MKIQWEKTLVTAPATSHRFKKFKQLLEMVLSKVLHVFWKYCSSSAQDPKTPDRVFFWLGAYGGCPKLQTYQFCIVMRYFEVRYLVYYQFI